MQIHYLERACPDYVRAAVQAASDIHREDAPGDILIFLTGTIFVLSRLPVHMSHVMEPSAGCMWL